MFDKLFYAVKLWLYITWVDLINSIIDWIIEVRIQEIKKCSLRESYFSVFKSMSRLFKIILYSQKVDSEFIPSLLENETKQLSYHVGRLNRLCVERGERV